MAGHVPRRLLKQPEVDECLRNGTKLWKIEESDNSLVKLRFFADPNGFFLYAKGNDRNKSYDSYIWDFNQISDVRMGKPPRESKLVTPPNKPGGDDHTVDDLCLTLVYRREGIINLDYLSLILESPALAEQFQKAVNALTANMLHPHAAPSVLLQKHCTKIRLHANARGEILLKDLNRLMMIRYSPDNFINQWLGTFNIVQTSVDGNTKFILEKNFTDDIFLKMYDQMLNNRVQDLDAVFALMSSKSSKSKGQLALADFHRFLNTDQRDPRLNEILHPYVNKDHASKLINRHEKGRRGDRLTSKGLLEYLMSDENNILDVDHLNQTHDMTHPLSHYFVNSSHNTYLTGHQLRSTSTVEMYTQALLLGCRCLELDCWPENDDIVITHGGTLCTKISFKDVVEAIDKFAFVTSEYPLILSIENHCKSKPRLIERMASIFKLTFGEKLVGEPFEDYPLVEGLPLPSPERLKRKILLKDKVALRDRTKKRSGDFGTLPKGITVPTTVDEDPVEADKTEEDATEGHASQNSDDVTVEPAVTMKEDVAENDETKSDTSNNDTPPIDDQERVNVETTDGPGDSGEGLSEEKDKEVKDVNGYNAEEVFQNNRTILRSTRSSDGSLDVSEINVSLLPRPSDVEAFVGSSPLRELLNYCTGITFEGFLPAERTNCSYYQSSFVEEKGHNLIRTSPKDFVKYNMRQISRIYPQGTRINSGNYMPQVYWNVGCQLVALNYQTPDLPMQLNSAKFEFNGATGMLLKPWVMRRERSQGGVFNPFVQSKLEDIVPAKISIKIISGYFLTDKRGANCSVEAEMYGLPGDTVRRKHFTKKLPAPHPHWNEETFTFKRVLLPELALLRIAVYNDDNELIGQRSLPVNAIRPGFRHMSLRDKYNIPLPLSMLFVHIKVEDWVPDEMEDIVSMLMDPISYATMALKAMTEGLDEGDENSKKDITDGNEKQIDKAVSFPSPVRGTYQPSEPSIAAVPTIENTSGNGADSLGIGIPPQLPASGTGTLKYDSAPSQLPYSFDDTVQCVENAKKRELPPVVTHDSILSHSDYRKLSQKLAKKKSALTKKQEKVVKSQREKLSKGKVSEDVITVAEKENTKDLHRLDREVSTELYEKKRELIESAHRTQLNFLMKKTHKGDIQQVNVDLYSLIKKHNKQGSDVIGDISRKDSMKDIEDKAIHLGKKARNELEYIHQREVSKLEDMQKEAIKDLVKTQAKELADLDAQQAKFEEEVTL